MISSPYQVQVPGKWILAGEHAVLRGSPALVFPLKSRQLKLAYSPLPDESLRLILAGDHGNEMQILFWEVFEKACEATKIHRSDFRGTLQLESRIPIGAGLGASAALCVAIGRWFQSMNLIGEADVYEFSRGLENLFHGESSGVDIAVALSGEGLRFLRAGERTPVRMNWTPQWYVSYSGQRGVTLECVNKVKALLHENPELGERIDQDMKSAVQMAETALSLTEDEGLPLLKKSMDLARSCYERWGLSVDSHLDWLMEQGAFAVKPTGSGGGGYVLSLWTQPPSAETGKILIPCLSL